MRLLFLILFLFGAQCLIPATGFAAIPYVDTLSSIALEESLPQTDFGPKVKKKTSNFGAVDAIPFLAAGSGILGVLLVVLDTSSLHPISVLLVGGIVFSILGLILGLKGLRSSHKYQFFSTLGAVLGGSVLATVLAIIIAFLLLFLLMGSL